MKIKQFKIDKLYSTVAKDLISYQWEEGGFGKVLRFDTNTLPTPPPSLSLLLKKFKTRCPINEYADPSYSKLKKLVADYERVSSDKISITNSGDEAIDILAKTFLDPDDSFLTTPPTYSMFSIQCEVNRGKSIEIPLVRDEYQLDTDKIISKADKFKPKLVFICNPNNPTGTTAQLEDIEAIAKDTSSIVVVDEVYREFYGKSAVSLLERYQNLVILRSFSKFAAMAGARIGYLIAAPDIVEKFEGIRFPMGVSYFSYKLAELVLENDKEWILKQADMIGKERERLSRELTQLGFHVFPSQANFLLVRIGKRAREIFEKLRQRGLLIRDRSSKKYLEGCVRITVRSPEENEKLLEVIKEIL